VNDIYLMSFTNYGRRIHNICGCDMNILTANGSSRWMMLRDKCVNLKV